MRMRMTAGLSVIIIFNLLIFTKAFPAQIAFTEDGREVILKSNRTWSYVDGDSGRADLADNIEIQSIIDLNDELKEDLRPFVMDEGSELLREFGFDFILGDLSFEKKYNKVITAIYRESKGSPHGELHQRLAYAVGETITDKIMKILEEWGLWERYCQ